MDNWYARSVMVLFSLLVYASGSLYILACCVMDNRYSRSIMLSLFYWLP